MNGEHNNSGNTNDGVGGGYSAPGGAPMAGSLFNQMYNAQQQYVQAGYYAPQPPPSHPNAASSMYPTFPGPMAHGAAGAPGMYVPSNPHAPADARGHTPPTAYAPYYPPPSHPSSPPPLSMSQDEDYYKGFHDGVVRPAGPVWGNALSWLAPLVINVAFFVGPIWYVRRKYMQSMGSAAAAASGMKGKTGAGSSKPGSNPMGWIQDMMNPMKAKMYRTEVKGTTFKDVIGIPEAKEDLRQYVDFLKDPSRFTRLGARLPKGCLLTGGPGAGKTLLARAVAGEASTPFLTCSGADFIEIFGGSGPKRVRELFAEAKACAPCVVFIDEIDAIGSRNSGGRTMGGGGGGSSEENRTINQLLAELDGLSSSEAIVVIAATNYPEAIDKALLREGRFDRKVNIPMPDKSARVDLFEFYLNRVVTGDANCKPKIQVFAPSARDSSTTAEQQPPQQPQETSHADRPAEGQTSTDGSTTSVLTTRDMTDVKVIPGVSNRAYAEVLADRTPGVTPAQIATIVNEAALIAATSGAEVVPMATLQESIDDVLIGKKHRQRMSAVALRRTAYHEVGHCIMAWLNPLQKDVIKMSIIPRGRAGGYTQQVQDEFLEPHTSEFLFSQLCVLMGGRVSERIYQHDISTGAMDDLQRATRLAMEKMLKYGMSKSIGQLAFKPNERNEGRAWMTWSEELHKKVEQEARELVAKAYETTARTLLERREQHVKLAELLLERKELSRDDIAGVLGERPQSSQVAGDGGAAPADAA